MITLQFFFQLLNSFFILNYIILCIISIGLNTLLFKLIQLNYLGSTLKNKFNFFINNKINLFTLYLFLFFYVFFIILNYNINIVYLDDSAVYIKAQFNETTVELTGEVLYLLLKNLGDVAAFTVGARIGAALVSKSSMGMIPKLTVISAVATGSTVNFKLASKLDLSNLSSTNEIPKIKVVFEDSLKSTLEKETLTGNIQSSLNKIFNLENLNSSSNKFTKTYKDNITTITSQKEETNQVINELNKLDPDWKDNFWVESPADMSQPIFEKLIDILTDQLYINIIIVYLLFMLTIILIIKLLINKDYKFEFLNKYPLGSYLSKFLVFYISIWHRSSNMWIFFIIFFVIIFNLNLIYSGYVVIDFLHTKI